MCLSVYSKQNFWIVVFTLLGESIYDMPKWRFFRNKTTVQLIQLSWPRYPSSPAGLCFSTANPTESCCFTRSTFRYGHKGRAKNWQASFKIISLQVQRCHGSAHPRWSKGARRVNHPTIRPSGPGTWRIEDTDLVNFEDGGGCSTPESSPGFVCRIWSVTRCCGFAHSGHISPPQGTADSRQLPMKLLWNFWSHITPHLGSRAIGQSCTMAIAQSLLLVPPLVTLILWEIWRNAFSKNKLGIIYLYTYIWTVCSEFWWSSCFAKKTL